MKTTPIYGIPYLDGSDLVSGAPEQFAKMANGVETALTEVDSRNTPAGVKPVIATTLETLAGITGVTGQAGYVTADPAEGNNGPYCWTGSAWARIATISDVSDILAEDSSTVMLINSTYGTIKGYRRGKLATLRIDWKSSASGSWTKGDPKDGGRCSTSISASAAATEPTRKPSTSMPTAPWTTSTMVAPKVLPLSAAR